MSILDRVTSLEPGETVMIKYTTDQVVTDLTLVSANAAVVVVSDGTYQFHVPNTAILWMAKPLKEEPA